MNPSPDAITKIRARFTDWSQPDDNLMAATINGTMVDNPSPQGTVPPLFNFENVVACLTTAEVVHIKEFITTEHLLNDVDAQNHLNVGRWAQMSMLSGDISPASGQKIIALVSTPVLDPNWQAQLPWPVVNMGRLVDADDVAAARAAGGA